MRGGDYSNSIISKIIFSYFLIDIDREKYYSKNWDNITEDSNQYTLFELDKVEHYLPINKDYLSWGRVHINTPELKIILGSSGQVFTVYSDRVELIKWTINGNLPRFLL